MKKVMNKYEWTALCGFALIYIIAYDIAAILAA